MELDFQNAELLLELIHMSWLQMDIQMDLCGYT
jgi:hypothetical protein